MEPTLPRICVWDDNAICSYSGAELGIQNIEVFFYLYFLFFFIIFVFLIVFSSSNFYFLLYFVPFFVQQFKPMEETLFNKHQPLRQFVDLTSLVGISLPSSQHPTLPAMLPTINPRYVHINSNPHILFIYIYIYIIWQLMWSGEA